LVTLTGPGGVGKTRLALRVADEVRPEFADGVAFVALALITNPDLILPTIARAVDIADHDGRPVTRALFSALRERHSLLILDNFEHLAPAAPLLIEVLAACPRIKILVTSRAVLRVTGEFEVVLPPLSLSGSPLASLVGEAPRAVVSIHGEAVELFFAATERRSGRPVPVGAGDASNRGNLPAGRWPAARD
jgi:predicted ATPase